MPGGRQLVPRFALALETAVHVDTDAVGAHSNLLALVVVGTGGFIWRHVETWWTMAAETAWGVHATTV